MTAPTLSRILSDLINGSTAALSRGLMFQFKQPDVERSFFRLFVYRKGDTPPSTNEFVIVRRELERLLPGVEIALGKKLHQYRAKDGLNRTGKIFSWFPVAGTQGALFDVPETVVRGGYE